MSDPVTIEIDYGWRATLEPHDPWLCVRLHPAQDEPAPGDGLIERLWRAIDDRHQRDVVLQKEDVGFLLSSLMGELVRLHKRLATQAGRLRLSGLLPACNEALAHVPVARGAADLRRPRRRRPISNPQRQTYGRPCSTSSACC